MILDTFLIMYQQFWCSVAFVYLLSFLVVDLLVLKIFFLRQMFSSNIVLCFC